jgi:hypothetical protein
MSNDNLAVTLAVGLIGLLAIAVIALFMWGLPVYGVWNAGQRGQATLKEADYSRQTKVVEAQANLEAEKLNAQAEVVRAGGVAKSNDIVKHSINDEYIRYLWVKTLDGAQKEIIYVPTEANLPLTEASRLQVTK